MGFLPETIGPFSTTQIIMAAILLGITYVAMFMLSGFLAFGFVFPIWMFICALMTVIVIIALLTLAIIGYIRWGPEGFVFARARKAGNAVAIDVELGSSNADFVIMEKENPKDVVLKDEVEGIKVDPAMLDSYCKPMSFPKGLDIYIFTFYNYMAQSIQNHAAFKCIEDDFKSDNRKILQFLSIKEYSELLSCPEHYLERNALVKLNKYFTLREQRDSDGNPIFADTEKRTIKMVHVRRFETWIPITDDSGKPLIKPDGTPAMRFGMMEQDITLSDMLKAIYEARYDISRMPIPGGLIAGSEAFKNNSVAYSSQHLSHVLMLYYSKMLEQFENRDKLLTYGIVGMMLLIGGGVSIYVISLAFKMFAGGSAA
jgi:hypothetical protein